jgi:hypothetical protein
MRLRPLYPQSYTGLSFGKARPGQVWHVRAGFGQVGQGAAWRGAARPGKDDRRGRCPRAVGSSSLIHLFGAARQCSAWCGQARPVWRGVAWRGGAQPGAVRPGVARQGMDNRRGPTRPRAVQGFNHLVSLFSRRGKVRRGSVSLVGAWYGRSVLGTVRVVGGASSPQPARIA